MNELGGIDTSVGAYDDDARTDERKSRLDQLRDQAESLRTRCSNDPRDTGAAAELTRLSHRIRDAGGDDLRLASNTPPSQSADEQARGYGLRLPVSASDAAPVQLDRPVSHLSTPAEVKSEIDQISSTLDFASKAGPAFLANVDRRLIDRLGDLQKRLPQVTAAEHAPAAPTHVELTHVHSAPEAHEGNAPQIAAMHVELTAVLHPTTFGSSLEVMTYANQYINYTAKHPEMRDLHDHAVANFGQLVDEATERDRLRDQGEMLVHDRVGMVQLRAPLGMEQMVAVSALGLLTAQTVHAIAAFVPIAGEVQAGLEALTGHGMWGLGEEKIEGVDRLLTAVTVLCGLAPYARKILNGAEAERDVARLARESGKTPEEIKGVLEAAVKADNAKARVRAALQKVKAGDVVSDSERAAVESVRGTFSAREGMRAGDVVRTADGDAPLELVESPTGAWGGPGVWVAKPEHMPPPSAAFQESVTGVRAGGHTYKVGGVEFDGVRVDAAGKPTLLEAKGDYGQFLVNGKPKPYVDWNKMLINKVKKQAETAIALGVPLEVHCLQREVSDILRRDLAKFGPSIKVLPMGAP